MGGHHLPNKGATDDWLTPKEIIDALGAFDLDPCCPRWMPWPTADRMLCDLDDGLSAPWHGRVWLNPPYGPETGRWLKKLAEHGEGIALVFARTETKMFQKWAFGYAKAMLFIAGRLHFCRPNGERSKLNAGAPSVLIAYGERSARILQLSDIEGAFVELDN
jgi:hypothetical protein